ncbi:MAG: hypothetical protein ABR573_03880 [Candidatus Dormibacteria bacterium]
MAGGVYAAAIALSASLLVQLGAPAPAMAAGRFDMQVTAGYDGLARPNDWVPVHVSVKNNGPDFRGRLRIDDGTAGSGGFASRGFRAPAQSNCCGGPVGFADRELDVAIPGGGTRRYNLYVAAAQSPRAALLDGGREVASAELAQTLTFTGSSVLLVGIVSDRADTLDHLSLVRLGGAATVHAVHLRPVDLAPSGILLRSFDALAFDDASTDTLTAEQKSALRDYVSAGGGLLLVGGPTGSKTFAGIPLELQPVRLSGAGRSDLAAVAGLAQAAPPPGGAVVSTGKLQEGAHAVSDGKTPLLAWGRFGAGGLVYAAFDPGAEPISSWAGEAALLRELVARASSIRVPPSPTGFSQPQSGRGAVDYSAISSVLNNLPSLDVPAAGLVGWLLFGYALLVGPVNYVVLKRLRRRHLAWVTIPTMIAIATASVLVVGFSVKGSGNQANQVRLVQLSAAGARTYVVTYTGVVVAHRGDYALSLPDTAFLGSVANNYQPGTGGVDVRGEPPQAQLPAMTAFSVRSVVAEGFASTGEKVTADLHLSGGSLVGTVTNGGPRDLEDAVVIYGRSFYAFGVLRRGQPAAVSLSALNINQSGGDIAGSLFPSTYNRSPTTPAERERQRRAQVLRAMTNTNFAGYSRDPMIIGFEAGTPQRPRVNGQEVPVTGETALVVTPTLAPDSQATTVAPGDVRPRLVGFDGDAQTVLLGPNFSSSMLHLGSGSAVIEMDLPGGGWRTADIVASASAAAICSGGPGSSTGGAVPRAVPVPVPVPPQGNGPAGATLPYYVQGKQVAGCVPGVTEGSAAVFNFKSGRWEPLASPRDGSSPLNPAGGQVADDGAVLLRVSLPAGSAPVNVSIPDISASRSGPA